MKQIIRASELTWKSESKRRKRAEQSRVRVRVGIQGCLLSIVKVIGRATKDTMRRLSRCLQSIRSYLFRASLRDYSVGSSSISAVLDLQRALSARIRI